jgi:hypothetical protein
MNSYEGDTKDEVADFIIEMGNFLSGWFEILAFLSIASKLNWKENKQKASTSGFVYWLLLYFISQTFDVLVTFGISFLAFEKNFFIQ